MSAKNKEIVGKVSAAFLEGNFEGFLDFCADDVDGQSSATEALQGRKRFANG